MLEVWSRWRQSVKPVNVAICDDEEYFLKELEKLVSVYANEAKCELEIDTYQDPERLVEEITSGKKEYQLIFLDVEMPGMSGVEAAKKLREEGYRDVICFVTGFEGYALDAFSVEAIGYICKPAQYLDIKKVIHKALIQIYYNWDVEEAKKRYLEVCTQKSSMMVDIRQILYLEKRRNQCVIHMETGEVVCYEKACPTVIYAVGNFKMRRVLKRHLAIDSPYNTYKNRGLPPGPIRLARPDVIDAVLNAPKTDYLYMCANPDFSGTHVFSSNYAKHSAVARQYQRELNQRKVK